MIVAARRGRPPSTEKLTKALADLLVETAQNTGLFDEQVSVMCGVEPKTLANWLRWGLHGNGKQPYADFARRYTQATIGVEAAQLKKIREAADWRASGWYLEKTRPHRYGDLVPAAGPREMIDIGAMIVQAAEQGANLVEVLRNPPPELLAALREAREDVLRLLESDDTDGADLAPVAGAVTRRDGD